VAIRDYLLRFLAEKGASVPPFVLTAVVALLCRIAKLGWFDDARHREIVAEVKI
jgi:exportin-7